MTGVQTCALPISPARPPARPPPSPPPLGLSLTAPRPQMSLISEEPRVASVVAADPEMTVVGVLTKNTLTSTLTDAAFSAIFEALTAERTQARARREERREARERGAARRRRMSFGSTASSDQGRWVGGWVSAI